MTQSDVIAPIEILTYSNEEGTVNGHPVIRGGYPTIHEACIALTVPYAQQAGHPVLTHAVDTIGAPAEYWLHVHPDGQATPTDLRPTAAALYDAPAVIQAIDVPAIDVPAIDVPAVVVPAAGQPAAGRMADDPWLRTGPTPVVTPFPPAATPEARASRPRRAARRHLAGDTSTGRTHVTGQVSGQAVAAPAVAAPIVPAPLIAATTVAAPLVATPTVAAPAPAPTPAVPLPAAAPVPAAPVVPAPPPPTPTPTLDDLLLARPTTPTGPAQLGWRATTRRLTGGLITLRPSRGEASRRRAIAAVQRSLSGPKTIAVINPKGGANKTTATLLIAATFGIHRGGYTLAWDNNETRGTMGWRAGQSRHTNTAVDLLRELDRFQDARSARVGDLDNFVRAQGSAQFDVLASDEDATSAASIDADAFNALHHSLSRFYRVIVIDTGNNMRASNWDAAVTVADQIVIVSTIREDTAQSAAWVADALNEKGYRDKVANAVTVLAAPSVRPDPALTGRLEDHFGRLTRAVVKVPFDPALVSGGPIDIEALSRASREAWLQATALVADGL